MNHLQLQQELGNRITSISKDIDSWYWVIRASNPDDAIGLTFDMDKMGVHAFSVDTYNGFIKVSIKEVE